MFPSTLYRLWRDHSLTITLTAIGWVFLAWAWWLEEGTGFDVVVGVGHGALTGALLYWLSGPLREKNKPED